MSRRLAPMLALAAGVVLAAVIAALVLQDPRDSPASLPIAILGASVLVQAAIVGLHRGGLGNQGRVGRATVLLAIGAPLTALLGVLLGTVMGSWAIAWVPTFFATLAVLAAWMVTAASLLSGGQIRSRGPILLVWGTLALFLVEPWNLRVLFALPVAAAWTLIGWDAWAALGRTRPPDDGADPARSRPPTARRAAAIGVAFILATGTLVGVGRLGARSPGTPGIARSTTAAVPVVIDTDSQPDDWIAISWLLARNDVTVRAITVNGSSSLGCDGSARHVLRLLALAKKTGIPVACGRPTSAAADHLFPADWLPLTQSLTETVRLPEPADAASTLPAVDVLRTAISTSPSPVVLVALGPLTNVADLLASADGGVTDNIAEIVVMGGAVDVDGNVGGDHAAAEWNIFVDPAAANDVLRSGAHVTLVALDACVDVPVTRAFVERLRARATTPAATYVADLLAAQGDFVGSGDYFFWDPLAAVSAMDGRPVGFVDRRLAVELGPDGGRVVGADDGGLVRLAVSADADAFELLMIEALVGAPAS